MISIDHEKCTRDSLCVAVCPIGIITMNGNGPSPAEGAEKQCINCGHCVTICPQGAISLQSMPVEQCTPLRKDWRLTPEQVGQLLQGRRSIRQYKPQPINREILAQIVDMASFAPSGHNDQPVRWLVIEDSFEVTRLAGLVIDWMRSAIEEKSLLARVFGMKKLVADWENGHDPILRKAPHLIIAHAPKKDKTAPQACTIGLTYLEIAAVPFGLGTCWAGYFQIALGMSLLLQEALALPDDHQSFGAMMLGYPKFEYQRIPKRNEAQVTWR